MLFKRGVCYYEINRLDLALEDFRKAWEFGYEHPEIDFYNGLILHHKGDFAGAARFYKLYLKELKEDDIDRLRVIKLIKQCGRAIDLSFNRPIAIVEQLPPSINSAFDEIGLIESPSVEDRYYFTSNKPNLSSSMEASDFDVYFISQELGKWEEEPSRMRYTINQRDHDILLGFTPNADGLYFFRGKEYSAAIFENRGSGDHSRTSPISIEADITLVNGDAFFYNDQVVIFSLKENMGYGGYDLYASVKQNGKWSKPKNLGPHINSPFDEVSPYLSADGSEIFFSSNREASIGGYDIYTSIYLYEADRWDTPENLGIPINSPGDERYFSLSYDGLKAFFSSNRKNSNGGMDIYMARFKEARGTFEYSADELAFIDYKLPIADPGTEKITLESAQEISEEITETESKPFVPDKVSEPVSFTYEPIYFTSSNELINKSNESQIISIIDWMKEHTGLHVEFVCHSNEEGIVEYQLYSSLKTAERLEQFFKQRGIDDDRIKIVGLGSSYPIAKLPDNGGDYKYSESYNSRIEIRFRNYDHKLMKMQRLSPAIPQFARDIKYELFTTFVEDAITYKIQIAMVNQMYRGIPLDQFNDTAIEEVEETGLYSYTIGLYDSYIEALKVKRDMDRMGITDAQVIAYYDGERLEEDRYSYFVNDFPDLKNLMNYGQ